MDNTAASCVTLVIMPRLLCAEEAGYNPSMRLVIDPAEDAAHEEWLRGTPGAYEWWYFDALSDDGQWAMACIWFLGNPFSPFYRLAALGQGTNPMEHNAVFFALYRQGRLHAYHFTRFPASQIEVTGSVPGTLQFGPNRLTLGGADGCKLTLVDENANRRVLEANLTFAFSPLRAQGVGDDGAAETHFWLPSAPACRVSGRITLREAQNFGAEEIRFTGHGYHDHNWGRLPFSKDIRDWYWARAGLGQERATLLYHVRARGNKEPISHLLLFDGGRLTRHDAGARVSLSRPAVNGFGTVYATQIVAESGDVRACFRLRSRLDSAPFYLRTLCEATVTQGGKTETGTGMGEYLRPRVMSWPLVASAMKARIVER